MKIQNSSNFGATPQLHCIHGLGCRHEEIGMATSSMIGLRVGLGVVSTVGLTLGCPGSGHGVSVKDPSLIRALYVGLGARGSLISSGLDLPSSTRTILHLLEPRRVEASRANRGKRPSSRAGGPTELEWLGSSPALPSEVVRRRHRPSMIHSATPPATTL